MSVNRFRKGLFLDILEFSGQNWQDLEYIAYYRIVSHLENRGVRVLIYGYYYLRRLHAHQMLDLAGYAAGDIYLRADRSSGLAYLMGIRIPA